MPAIDVTAEIQIAAEPTDIASVMFDPQREPEWIAAVKSVEVVDPAIKAGARVRRTGSFLGRELAWTTAVQTFHFPHVLVLQLADGPLTGEVAYQIQRSGAGSVVRIRARGETNMLGFLPAAMIDGPMRAALDADLGRLKAIVERRHP
ncbi:MAG TPA: SRPBCC family protein [Vicinamibacterales bacterium]|nr:SRPBCC family protein [Vicinamibacterales bacterium]